MQMADNKLTHEKYKQKQYNAPRFAFQVFLFFHNDTSLFSQLPFSISRFSL